MVGFSELETDRILELSNGEIFQMFFSAEFVFLNFTFAFPLGAGAFARLGGGC